MAEQAGAIIVEVHPQATERLPERGASDAEVEETVRSGERIPAKFGRTGFRRNFAFDAVWRGRRYHTKQLEVYAVFEDGRWLVITVITRFF